MPEALKAVMGLGKYRRRCPNQHRKAEKVWLASIWTWCPECGAMRFMKKRWLYPKWRAPDA